MALYLLLLLVCLPILLLCIYSKHYINRSPPGPRGLPFIGNLHQFDASAPHIYLWQLSKKYGPIMSLKLGSVTTLIISSASMAQEVFKEHDRTFSGRPALLAQQKLSYNGLDLAFSTDYDYWREIRKLCTLHLFTSKRAQSFRPIREDEVARMVAKIKDWVTSSCSNKPINLSETVITATSTVICRIALGKRYNEETGTTVLVDSTGLLLKLRQTLVSSLYRIIFL